MILTQNQINVLGFKVLDPQNWADEAEANCGLSEATKRMEAKVARWQESYDRATSENKNRLARQSTEQALIDNHPDKPMNDWKESMQGTDYGMPRYAEDILDGMSDKSGVSQITLDRLQAKKTLRGTKP